MGHLMTLVTRPEPTVRPPSRMAKPRPSSMGDGLDELDGHLGGVAGHDHLGALGEGDDTGDVRGTEVELRTVVRVEGVVAAASSLVRM